MIIHFSVSTENVGGFASLHLYLRSYTIIKDFDIAAVSNWIDNYNVSSSVQEGGRYQLPTSAEIRVWSMAEKLRL